MWECVFVGVSERDRYRDSSENHCIVEPTGCSLVAQRKSRGARWLRGVAGKSVKRRSELLEDEKREKKETERSPQPSQESRR